MNKANIIKKRNLFGNDNMGKEGVVNEVGAMDMKFAGNVSDIQISLSIIHLFYLSNQQGLSNVFLGPNNIPDEVDANYNSEPKGHEVGQVGPDRPEKVELVKSRSDQKGMPRSNNELKFSNERLGRLQSE